MNWMELLLRWIVSGVIAYGVWLIASAVYFIVTFDPKDYVLIMRVRSEIDNLKKEKEKERTIKDKLVNAVSTFIWPWWIIMLTSATVRIIQELERRTK